MENNIQQKLAARIDPLTKERFVPKRKNQVFANWKNRIDYHNFQKTVLTRKTAEIDGILKNNYKILLEIIQNENFKVITKDFLDSRGFNHFFITHLDEVNNQMCGCIYHFTLQRDDNTNSITIINKKHD